MIIIYSRMDTHKSMMAAGSGLMAYRDFKPGVTPETRLTEEELNEIV